MKPSSSVALTLLLLSLSACSLSEKDIESDLTTNFESDGSSGGTNQDPPSDSVQLPTSSDSIPNDSNIPEPSQVEFETPEGFGISLRWPGQDATNIALANKIIIEFNSDVMDESFSPPLIKVRLGEKYLTGEIVKVSARRYEFIPQYRLQASQNYTVELASVMSTEGIQTQASEWQFSSIANVGNTSQDIIDLCMSSLDIEMLASVNHARSESRNCGDESYSAVADLAWNCDLQSAAIAHSQDMKTNNFFSHSGSNGSSSAERVLAEGYRYRWVGENIAAGYFSVASVMQGWLESPGHCVNIMREQFTEFGMGYIESDSSTEFRNYWTQNFGDR